MTLNQKHPLFSKGLYTEGLKRLRAFGIIAFCLILATQIMPLLASLFVSTDYDEKITTTINMSDIMGPAPTMCIFGAPLMVFTLFSVFNKRSSSDFFHALPYTRPCIFLSFMASVYTWIIGICTAGAAASLILYLAQPSKFAVTLDRSLDLILSYVAILLISTGAATLAMALTGTSLTNISVALIIMFLPRFIISIITNTITLDAEFLVINTGAFSFLSPATNVLFGMFYGGDELFTNTAQDIYSVILGLAYLALGMLAFIKRKSETATRPAPDRITQTVIRIMVSLVMALFALTLLFEDEFTGFVVISAITVIIYFTYEIVTTKSLKNCLKALPGLGILAGITALCGVLIVAYPAVASRYIPDAESIDSVRFVTDRDEYYYYYNSNGWFGKDAENIAIEDKGVIKAVADALKDNMEYYDEHGCMTATDRDDHIVKVVAIRDGFSVKYRRIFFSSAQYGELSELLQKNEEYREAYKNLPDPVSGSFSFDGFDISYDRKTVDKLMASLRAEVDAMEFESWYNAVNNPNKSYYDTMLSYYTDEYDSNDVYIHISAEDFPKTFDMLLDMSSHTRNKGIEKAEALLGDDGYIKDANYMYVDISVSVRTVDENGKPVVYHANTMYGADEKFDGKWDSETEKKAIDDFLKKGKLSKEKPSHDKYVFLCIMVDGEDENGYYSDQYYAYLPVPEDYDFKANNFHPIEIEY